jgi:hypothetical protein
VGGGIHPRGLTAHLLLNLLQPGVTARPPTRKRQPKVPTRAWSFSGPVPGPPRALCFSFGGRGYISFHPGTPTSKGEEGEIMVRVVAAAVVAVSSIIVAGCGGAGDSPTTVTVRDTVTSSGVANSPSAPPPVPSSPAAEQTWTMPDLRGRNLQDAQDAIQQLTNNEVVLTGSTDLTGQARNQMMDRNWQVCTSTPAAGESFTKTTAIDFGVVRIDTETCP